MRDRHGKSLGKREITLGERLGFRHNRAYAQITNNETGTIMRLAQGPCGPKITVRKDDGMEIVLAPEATVPQGRVERRMAPAAGYAQFDYAQPDIENDLAALCVENEVTGMEAIQAIIKAMSTSRLKDTSLGL